jgi:hypothetical protein
MHPDRENIFAVGPEERRAMIRTLFVELQCPGPRDDDSSQRPIYEQALFFGAIVTSGDMVKQEAQQSPESVQNLTISAWCSSHGNEDCLGPDKSFRVGTRGWWLFLFISNFNLWGLFNSLRMLILADAIRWITLHENSSLGINLNKFLDLLLQLSGFGRRTVRTFRHETFTHAALISFHLEIGQCADRFRWAAFRRYF